ncbi:MAG: hypothetical protein HQL41_03270 [Alphaproteobacteria bacterium]|nr:hypothetical protein [Alphaproteobacteria bacterium]
MAKKPGTLVIADRDNGTFKATAGDDTLISSGWSGDTLQGGAGDDLISVTGGTGHSLEGGAGNDTLSGSATSNAVFDGGGGTDVLTVDGGITDYVLTAQGPDWVLTPLGGTGSGGRLSGVETIVFGGDGFVLNLTHGNMAPYALPFVPSVGEDGPSLSGQLAATDLDGDPLTFALTSGPFPATGAFAMTAGGAVSYDPGLVWQALDDGETAQVAFGWSVTDGKAVTTQTGTITIIGANDAPIATGFASSWTDGALPPVGWGLSASDVEGDPLVYSLTSGPASARFALDASRFAVAADGSITFSPGAAFAALGVGETDMLTFAWTVSDGDLSVAASGALTITGINDAPLTTPFQASAGPGDDVSGWRLTATDIDGDGLAYALLSAPRSAGLTLLDFAIAPDGVISFDAAAAIALITPGSSETFTFTWQVDDGNGGVTAGTGGFVLSAPAPSTVQALNGTVRPHASLAAASLVDSGEHVVTAYEFRDTSAHWGSGYFTVNGVRQADGVGFTVAAADLDDVAFVGGEGRGGDGFAVRASNGTVWSAWDAATVTTRPALTGSEPRFTDGSWPSRGHPHIAVAADGGFAIASYSWGREADGNPSVQIRFYDAEGAPITRETNANTPMGGSQTEPRVCALAGGGWAVIWPSGVWPATVANSTLYVQIYDDAGQPVGANRLLVGGVTQSNGIMATPDGGFMVASIIGSEIRTLRCDSQGNLLETTVVGTAHQVSHGYQEIALVPLAEGGWVVAWGEYDASGLGVWTRRYDAAGVALGGPVQVNQSASGHQEELMVTALAGGGFVVGWTSFANGDGAPSTFARIYDDQGQAIGGEFALAQGISCYPLVAGTPDGGFTAMWSQPEANGWAYHMASYDATGTRLDAPERMTQARQYAATGGWLAAQPDGGLVAAWPTWNGGTIDLLYQVLSASGGTWFGTNGDDTLAGTADAETVLFGRGSGADRVSDSFAADGDVIRFAPDVAADQLWLSREGDDLVLAILGGTDRIAVQGWYASPDNRVEVIAGDGLVLDAGAIDTLVAASGDGYFVPPRLVDAIDGAIRPHAALAASSLVDEGDHVITAYEFRDTSAHWGSGYFTVNGVRQADGVGFTVAAADLDDVAFVGGEGRGDDGFAVRASNGTVWSAWDQGMVTTLAPPTTSEPRLLDTSWPSRTAPDIAVAANGDIAIARYSWYREDGNPSVQIGFYDAAGNPTSPELAVNAPMAGSQTEPRVCALEGGGWAVIWPSGVWPATVANSTLYVQIYDEAGQPVGANRALAGGTTQFSDVMATPDGGFMVAGIFGGAEIRTLRCDAQGNLLETTVVGSAHQVSHGYQEVGLVRLADGGHVVAWSDYDTSALGVYARRYDEAGDALGSAVQINQSTSGFQEAVTVAALAGGGFVIGWASYANDGAPSTFARIYDDQGAPLGDEFALAPGVTSCPLLAGTPDGGFTAMWNASAAGSWGAWMRDFDALGTPLGESRQMPQQAYPAWMGPIAGALAATPDGGLVATWATAGPDVFYQVFGGPGGTWFGTNGDDTLAGTADAETILFGRGSGADLVSDSFAADGDVIRFAPDVAADQLWLSRAGDDLVLAIQGETDRLTVQGWYASPDNRMDVLAADGLISVPNGLDHLGLAGSLA